MKRIAVIGSAGSGKSTLAVELGRRTGLPVTHLDRVFWRRDWTHMPKPEFLAEQQQLARGDEWIIDGNYDSSLPIRLTAADTIIFLDLPTALCTARVLWRTIRHPQRPDMADSCRQQVFTKDYFEFLLWIWNYRRDNRPRVLDLLAQYCNGKAVYHLRSRSAVNAFLKDHP